MADLRGLWGTTPQVFSFASMEMPTDFSRTLTPPPPPPRIPALNPPRRIRRSAPASEWSTHANPTERFCLFWPIRSDPIRIKSDLDWIGFGYRVGLPTCWIRLGLYLCGFIPYAPRMYWPTLQYFPFADGTEFPFADDTRWPSFDLRGETRGGEHGLRPTRGVDDSRHRGR